MTPYLILFAMVVFIAICVVCIHNSIIQRFNRVKQAWEDVLVSERQKLKILPQLQELLKGHKSFEQSILNDVTKLRTAIDSLTQSRQFATAELAGVHEASKQLTTGLRATFEAYPDLKSSQLYSQVMSEISEQEDNVGAAIRIYNSNVQAHNTAIQIFPNSLINSIFTRKKAIDGFTDSAASASIEYTPKF